jgi:actin-related protein
LYYPIERGLVVKWDDMGKLWDCLFEWELGIKPSERPVLITVPSLNLWDTSQKTAEIMFEKFNVPALYLFNHTIAALSASASVTGLVVDSGDSVTCTILVYEGYSFPHAVTKLYVAGRDITKHLIWLLFSRVYNFPCVFNKATQKVCLVTFKSEKEVLKRQQESGEYKQPDKNVIQIRDHLCQVPEVLFAPDQPGINNQGLPQMVCSSIAVCDTDIQKNLEAMLYFLALNKGS